MRYFRPPYGRITFAQSKALRNKYKIIIWSRMSGDFDLSISNEECLIKLKKKTKPGDIVVFHDNLKSFEKLKYVLPRYIEHFSLLGYKFETISV